MHAIHWWVLLTAAHLAAVLANSQATAVIGNTSKSISLDDWMEVRHARTYAHPVSHRQLHKDRACFKPTYISGKTPFDYIGGGPLDFRGFLSSWFRTSLVCCNGRRKHDSRTWLDDQLPGATGPTVGSCTLLAKDPEPLDMLEVSKFTAELFPFNVICTLDSAADKCGPSGCGDLTLQAQGNTYFAVAASRSLLPPSPPPLQPTGRNSSCSLSVNFTSVLAGAFVETPGLRSRAGSFLSDKLTGPTKPWEKQVYVGPAIIYSGPMTIRSKTHETEWKEGWFDLVVPFCPEGWLQFSASEVPSSIPFVKAEDSWTYRMEFNRPEEAGNHGHEGDSA